MRRHTNLAHSGDQSFQYDILAEGALKQIVEKLGVRVTVMSEDKGLVNGLADKLREHINGARES